MKDIITIEIIEKNDFGHKDLKFSIPSLFGDLTFDTYYFILAIEHINTINDIKNAVAQLLQFWVEKIQNSKNSIPIYLPIDFSDQYTGCMKVIRQDMELILSYGFTNREGYTVNPINPDNFYRNINDFRADPDKQVSIEANDFIYCLYKQMQNLKK